MIDRRKRKPNQWRKFYRQYLKSLLGITRIADIPTSVVVWAGPSRLNGEAVMVVATRVREPSDNGKTGDAIQLAIMAQAHSPMEAWTRGLDGAVCPDACGHKSKPRGGQGTCYVNKSRLQAAWEAAIRYLEAHGTPMPIGSGWQIDPSHLPAGFFRDAIMRFGMEGDPSAVPLSVWQGLASEAKRHLGYTAEWRSLPIEWATLFMASVGRPADALRAKSAGWRPFAASESAADDLAFTALGLRECLADAIGLPCVDCGGCDGTSRGSRRAGYRLAMHGALGAALRRSNAA